MPLFRKKPVVIEARYFDGSEASARDLLAWMQVKDGHAQAVIVGIEKALDIETKEGVMTAIQGDWIIRGVAGEFYPIKPEIFDVTYEPVKE